jgi:hypothetical protein
MLSEWDQADLRRNFTHLSRPAVPDFNELAYRDCRLISDRVSWPKQIQTPVQV